MCAEYRIPHSEFLGWLASDRSKAIWWHLRQREACPSCGTRPDEWNPDKGGHRFVYEPKIRQCAGCVELERTREDETVTKQRGMHVVLVRNREV